MCGKRCTKKYWGIALPRIPNQQTSRDAWPSQRPGPSIVIWAFEMTSAQNNYHLVILQTANTSKWGSSQHQLMRHMPMHFGAPVLTMHIWVWAPSIRSILSSPVANTIQCSKAKRGTKGFVSTPRHACASVDRFLVAFGDEYRYRP
jgi:hypothetical protein